MPASASGSPFATLWRRSLTSYPEAGRRYGYLAIVVVVTIELYYLLYIQFAVATSIMVHFEMTFTYFVWVSVVGNAVGAFASLVAGLADRWGRANLVVYGLLVAGLLVLALPEMPNREGYLVLFIALNFVEGIVLVATPALIRDFSPQLGRATAMGYWTMGPVLGSLIVTVVTSTTLDTSTWQDEVRYSAYSALVVFVVALFGLRELSPQIRDQIMVSLHDRALVEARAAGHDTDRPATGLWRQMMRLDVLGPAFAISVYLLLYYSLVGNLVIYFSTVFGYTEQEANGLANWYWASTAIGLLGAGLLSDRLKVRKPLMLIGGLGTVCTTTIFALFATRPETAYASFATLFVVAGALGGLAYTPWMAAFTETIERHNPAATATGLAVWGWIVRVVVSVSAAILPLVVTSVTPLVEHGGEVAAAQAKAGPALAITEEHPQIFAELGKYPPGQAPAELTERAVREVGAADLKVVQDAGPQLAVLAEHGPAVAKAAEEGPGQWQIWWWVAVAGQLVFIPFIFVMGGRWSPRRAREDAEAHQKAVDEELARLRKTPTEEPA